VDQCQEDGLEQDHGQAKVDERYYERGIQEELGMKGSDRVFRMVANGDPATENNLSQKKIARDERSAKE
jgi:hypothetical protein